MVNDVAKADERGYVHGVWWAADQNLDIAAGELAATAWSMAYSTAAAIKK